MATVALAQAGDSYLPWGVSNILLQLWERQGIVTCPKGQEVALCYRFRGPYRKVARSTQNRLGFTVDYRRKSS
jgi:hypothetical protein